MTCPECGQEHEKRSSSGNVCPCCRHHHGDHGVSGCLVVDCGCRWANRRPYTAEMYRKDAAFREREKRGLR